MVFVAEVLLFASLCTGCASHVSGDCIAMELAEVLGLATVLTLVSGSKDTCDSLAD